MPPGHALHAAALLGRLSPTRSAAKLTPDEAATVIQTEWRGYDARIQLVSRRKLRIAQIREQERAEKALAAVILEDFLDKVLIIASWVWIVFKIMKTEVRY